MNLLNDQNPIHIFLNKLGDIILGNILFLLFCIPIITIGPSLTALYHCMLRSVKGNGGSTVKTFIKAFKDNFFQSLIAFLGLALTAFIVIVNLRFWKIQSSSLGTALYYLSLILLLFLIFTAMYLFPVIASFYNTTGKHLRNAVLFVFLHFPVTIVTTIITVLPLYMTYRDLDLLPLYSFCWFFFGFGLIAYINSLFFYRIFKPHLEPQP